VADNRISVTLYTPYWYNMGGGEKYLCVMAETLAGEGSYDVGMLSDSGPLDQHTLERYFSVSLDQVRLQQIAPRHVRKMLRESDIAVIMTNFRSMGLPSVNTLYVLQIPYPDITTGSLMCRIRRGEIRESGKDLLRLRLLATCRKAPAVFVYSEFVQSALLEHHRLATSVLHPPIDDFSSNRPKEQSILSVGRIFRGPYNDKRYDVLLDAFRTLHDQQKITGWQYWIAGSCGNDRASQAWLAELKARAQGYPVSFYINVPYTTLSDLYGRASLLWHAAGYGIDEHEHPERTEHFGMAPVEAMSARCIPLVVNAGGTRETVGDGVSGFFWSTTDDLLHRTERFIGDPVLRMSLQQGARDRFEHFSRKAFARTVIARFRNLTTEIRQETSPPPSHS
jgi:glycosyltransferase involved in cell wall biosynthesis